jgi:hypothetical protein
MTWLMSVAYVLAGLTLAGGLAIRVDKGVMDRLGASHDGLDPQVAGPASQVGRLISRPGSRAAVARRLRTSWTSWRSP